MTGSADADWGPWVLHDGKGCPCVGEYVQVVVQGNHTGRIWVEDGIAGSKGGKSWDWANKNICSIFIRYRIRRAKGMAILNAILADLPAPVKTDGVIA